MEKKILSEIPISGLPLYEMQELFNIEKEITEVKISYFTLLPGVRVPSEGTGAHEEDEYAFFLEGEVYTESGDFKGICKAGEATLIPRGEEHWSRNETDKPCRLICVLVK